MTETAAMIIQAVAITPEAYAPYGEVIAVGEGSPFRPANFGNAQRFDWLAPLENLRPQSARLNLCLFRCRAFVAPEMQIKMLEKHPFSTQVFMPMHDGRYITIVALGGDQPDLGTLSAFVAGSGCGISYKPGVWHYPMTALERELDLSCLVFEDDGPGDCVVHNLAQPVTVRL